ncbi:hypothetical protein C0995_010748 [Termitomyces sp. Mi166|nr:hypothetical protein C0995_010748 [Termitomyces sp. Mi166\
MHASFVATVVCALFTSVQAIGQDTCVAFEPNGASTLPVVEEGKASPIFTAADDWPGVHLAVANFAADIQRVTGIQPTITNFTSEVTPKSGTPIIVGTLGKSSLITQVVNATQLDVSAIEGKWEAFLAREVQNPFPGVSSAYVIIGADKRGTIFALYDHSEQFGVSPWYWWADVPITNHSELFVTSSGCAHGTPTVKYRGIFLNDEQPALQNWAAEKFTNGTTNSPLGSPFNHFFYGKLFELLHRIKANYLWPAMWSSAFAVDDTQNQYLADLYGIVMGTSHQEPMMRSTPNEFTLYGNGTWDYTTNAENIKAFWLAGTQRAKNFESVYTVGMRGFGDLPLSENTNIELLEQVISDQTAILQSVYGDSVQDIPQVWTLYKEVEGYYDAGMTVPDYITLLWSDDNWGNIRRLPLASERNRTGGAGVYYHIYEQMSLAVDREATRLWILNVGDLKPYERETEFFINFGWNATRWNVDNLESFVSSWAQREFTVSPAIAENIVDIVRNLTRFNSRRKPELLSTTTYSLINYREAENVLADWAMLKNASTTIYDSLASNYKGAFFQLIQHPILASANVANLFSTNALADQAVEYFEADFDLETEYHSILDGKWDHMMDQTHLGYYYWQQPTTNSMPAVNRVQSKKQNIAGVMRIVPEGTAGAWPGDNQFQCAQGYDCGPPTVTLDPYSPFGNIYVDVGAGGPAPFTFTVSSSESWVNLSTTQGSISASHSEERVFLGVKDWSALGVGTSTARVTFTATSANTSPLSVGVMFNAIKFGEVPSDFKGFVEGGGAISIEAAHATRNNTVNGIAWREIAGYGRTLSGVTTFPRDASHDVSFAPGTGPSLEYDFYSFTTISNSGNITATVYVSPSWNAGEPARPLAFAVQLDAGTPQTIQFFPNPEEPGQVPTAWGGLDGFVANGVVSAVSQFKGVQAGKHTLKIWAVEPAVVIQKIVIGEYCGGVGPEWLLNSVFLDTGGVVASYLGPPESVLIE